MQSKPIKRRTGRPSLRAVVGASLPRLHYYAKCVEILSKAKPWERVRVVKALCLLVGINRPNGWDERPLPSGSLQPVVGLPSKTRKNPNKTGVKINENSSCTT